VCLHTDDVPASYIALLSKVWDCRLIEHVASAKSLTWSDQADRFEHVFTKLKGMSLVEFEKIIMMDIDMLVLKNVDDLFELAPPAAMKRGMNTTSWGSKHGDPIDGRPFFTGAWGGKYSWGQGTGINAGVMLWRPDTEMSNRMLSEVAEPYHPAHVRSNGPEQDFLSRYWADSPWTNVECTYNFQLHQMFYALNPNTVEFAERIKLLDNPEQVKIIHYSGEPLAKPWCRLLHSQFQKWWPGREHDDAYFTAFCEEFRGYWLWLQRDRNCWDRMEEMWIRAPSPNDNFRLGSDGEIYRMVPNDSTEWPDEGNATTGDGEPVTCREVPDGYRKVKVTIPESAKEGCMKLLDISLKQWFETFDSLQKQLGIDIVEALGGPKHHDDTAHSWKPSWFARPLGPPGTNSSTSNASPSQSSQPSHPSQPSPTSSRQHQQSADPLKIRYRRQGGWMHELVVRGNADSKADPATASSAGVTKASVACGVRDECSRFVMFNAPDSAESFFPGCDDDVCGVYVKVLGRDARTFTFEDDDISAMAIWAEGVKLGDVVLLAIVNVEDPKVLDAVFLALQPLGVPQGQLQPDCRALAAAGVAGSSWDSTHASTDIAYASIPVCSQSS